ncbi:MAG: N-acetyltransferase [Actinomycetia bacterium]|nr:N-acetyltransferase [Actinomycetes bacterium]
MAEFARRATARWRAIDSLLPDAVPEGGAAPGDKDAHCGASLAVGAGGNLAAFGTCRHTEPDPAEIDLSWGMARRFELAPRVVGPGPAAALDRLIGLWRDHLADVPGSDEDDTAAVITWPSRDIEGVAALQRHGLRPLAVAAIRAARRAGSATRPGTASQAGTASWGTRGPGGQAGNVRVRRAGPRDVDAVARFGAEVARFDAHFSGTPERPGTGAALRREAARLLGRPDASPAHPWTWLAERDGRPVGMIATQWPEHAAWIAPLTRLSPVAYTVLGYVTPDERSSGVGSALAAHLHDTVDLAGVAATLLHYEQLNPYAAPFWSRQRYRPLWTTWEARPARSLR